MKFTKEHLRLLPGGDDELERELERRDAEEAAVVEEGGALTPSDVFRQWRAEGPLVHEPTGIETLDEATTGGPVYGTRWFIAGAPDAGKTALLVQIAHTMAERGVMAGLLAVDEEPGDMLTRFVQRVGHSRQSCEVRSGPDLDQIEAKLAHLPLRLYDATWTVEAAAEDLARAAEQAGMRAMLGVDSIQTVRCEAELDAKREVSTVDAISSRAMALRYVASHHRMIVIATSEMNRGAYRSKKADENVDDMAAAKGSGAIEYQARVLVTLRSEEGGRVKVTLPKNKHQNPGSDAGREPFCLKLDRYTQWLEEVEAPADGMDEADGAIARTLDDAAAVAVVLARKPGLGKRELRAELRAHHAMGRERVDAALAMLDESVVMRPGERRGQKHYIDGRDLPEPVLARVIADRRSSVITARPPSAEVST